MPRNRNLLSPANPIEQFRQMCLGVKSPCVGSSPTESALSPFQAEYSAPRAGIFKMRRRRKSCAALVNTLGAGSGGCSAVLE